LLYAIPSSLLDGQPRLVAAAAAPRLQAGTSIAYKEIRTGGGGCMCATDRRKIMLGVCLAGAAGALALTAAGPPFGHAVAAEPKVIEMPDGLKYTDDKLGNGATATTGTTVSVHYTGWLYKDGAKGAKFDSSLDRGQPFEFTLGAHQVIAGWDEGVAGMKVGGERTLIIPPELGYGARGAGGVIPPNATLIFDVRLIAVQ
jgi:FKBP-type peptidyl-prolyl cis-trans isomerase FkpA